MITEDDIRRLGQIRATSDDAHRVFKEHAAVFKPLTKLFLKGMKNPLMLYDDTDWLLALIEREVKIDTRRPEETIKWLKVMNRDLIPGRAMRACIRCGSAMTGKPWTCVTCGYVEQ